MHDGGRQVETCSLYSLELVHLFLQAGSLGTFQIELSSANPQKTSVPQPLTPDSLPGMAWSQLAVWIENVMFVEGRQPTKNNKN